MNDRTERPTDNATPFPWHEERREETPAAEGPDLRHMLNRMDSMEHQQAQLLDALRVVGRMPGIEGVTLSGATYTATEETAINNLNIWVRQVDAILRAAGLSL